MLRRTANGQKHTNRSNNHIISVHLPKDKITIYRASSFRKFISCKSDKIYIDVPSEAVQGGASCPGGSGGFRTSALTFGRSRCSTVTLQYIVRNQCICDSKAFVNVCTLCKFPASAVTTYVHDYLERALSGSSRKQQRCVTAVASLRMRAPPSWRYIYIWLSYAAQA